MPPRAKIQVDLGIAGQAAVKQVKTLAGKINSVMGKIKPIAGMVLGAGGVYAIQNAIRKTIDFDLALTRLAIQGHKTVAEQAKVREEIIRVAEATGMAKEEILAAGKSVIDSTGDFDFMVGTLENLTSLAMTTGSDMGGLGKVTGALGNVFKFTAEDANELTRAFVEQGEKGAYTLEEMATTAPKVFAAAYQAGVRTKDELKSFMGYMQVMRTGYAEAEAAATGYSGLITRLGAQSKKLDEDMDIKVFDEDTGKQRDVAAVMMDIFDKIGTRAEDLTKIQAIFGESAMPAVTAMAGAYDEAAKNGNNLSDELKKFTDVTGDAETQAAKLARLNKTAAGQFNKLGTTLDGIMTKTLVTEENMENLGIAAEGAAKALVVAVEGLQETAAWLAKQADRLGFVEHGGRAEDAASMTPEQVLARQAMHEATMLPASAMKSAQAQAFEQQYTGSETKKKFMGMDMESLAPKLGAAAAGSAAVGALPLAALLAGAALLAPKAQDYMQDKEAEKFARELELSDATIDKIASAVEKGAEKGGSKAKPTVEMLQPMSTPTGTQGKPVHEPS